MQPSCLTLPRATSRPPRSPSLQCFRRVESASKPPNLSALRTRFGAGVVALVTYKLAPTATTLPVECAVLTHPLSTGTATTTMITYQMTRGRCGSDDQEAVT